MYKNYSMFLTMSFITLAYGAAGSSVPSCEDQSNTSMLRVASIYDIQMVKVPESPIIHVPFVAGYNYRPHILTVIQTKSLSRKFRGYIGFVSGCDRTAVTAIAEAAIEIISAGYNSGPKAQKAYVTRDGSYYEFWTKPEFLTHIKNVVGTTNPHLVHLLQYCEITYKGWVGDRAPQVYLPHPYRVLIDKAQRSKYSNNTDTLVESIKAVAEKERMLAKRKDPDTEFIEVPMLVRRSDLTAFCKEAFSRQHKKKRLEKPLKKKIFS